ncbi:hypothetical protein M408DRAFT_331231 [Serendipita vermifera MAFF 305830]|uniref:Uncharacterized protein n=1 Tax=Serendipita vermifera MAFF 305830 TaxID=933852 RepID=A0A0C3AL17_SERVB|nr:hypothetical protein M408DRAFT_331231 [Serendipita vermifera MAFF 305830]
MSLFSNKYSNVEKGTPGAIFLPIQLVLQGCRAVSTLEFQLKILDMNIDDKSVLT